MNVLSESGTSHNLELPPGGLREEEDNATVLFILNIVVLDTLRNKNCSEVQLKLMSRWGSFWSTWPDFYHVHQISESVRAMLMPIMNELLLRKMLLIARFVGYNAVNVIDNFTDVCSTITNNVYISSTVGSIQQFGCFGREIFSQFSFRSLFSSSSIGQRGGICLSNALILCSASIYPRWLCSLLIYSLYFISLHSFHSTLTFSSNTDQWHTRICVSDAHRNAHINTRIYTFVRKHAYTHAPMHKHMCTY